jgi:Pentapeptide repeats (8 copies)
MIEIKSWRDGKVLYIAKTAADVRSAVEEAVREKANLGYADLGYADLRSTDLGYADLRSANLGSANLRYADLRYAKNYNPYRVNDLLLLLDQPGKIRAYKLTDAQGNGPFTGGIKYAVGESYEVSNASTDAGEECGAGINLATLPWCMKEWGPGCRIFVAEFKAADIAAIPSSDGKFRVHRCKVVAEKDLEEIGLVVKEELAEVAA